jgi:hypothetical protein
MGSGLPQFGFPRRFAIDLLSLLGGWIARTSSGTGWGTSLYRGNATVLFYGYFLQKSIGK